MIRESGGHGMTELFGNDVLEASWTDKESSYQLVKSNLLLNQSAATLTEHLKRTTVS